MPRLVARLPVIAAMAALAGLAPKGRAQVATPAPQAPAAATLDPVFVSAMRGRQGSFETPAAIGGVDRETLELAGPQVNVSEALNRVPGIAALNRQNYAQDVQLSIRGFGARSTFGIRGVRLLVDGIPASMPDGQGQASNVALGSVGRVEVLRGPLAQLYGNAAGGVVQFFSLDEPGPPTALGSLSVGAYGATRLGARYTAGDATDTLLLDAAHFRTDGYREHSAAQRGTLNLRWRRTLSPGSEFAVVVNALEMPRAEDPSGLTRAQWESDPRQAQPIAVTQDARKSVRQQQIGATLQQRLGEATTLDARLYLGTRDLSNALSLPPNAQTATTSAGGIVQFARGFGGLAVQVAHAVTLDEGRSLRLVAGVEHERLRDDRQGYVNNNGQAGQLKRDEVNEAETRDAFVQGALGFARDWTLTLGARASDVRFRSRDRFIVPGNPDDSGEMHFHATNPVAGLAWRPAASLNLYANVGRGFETPTLTEAAYRSTSGASGSGGLNTALLASRSRHAELGVKWRASETQRLDVALFDIATSDELVVAANAGGRTTYRNAGRTNRRGLEVSHIADWTPTLRSTLALTWLRARFVDSFVSGSGASAVTVPSGARIPGTPDRNAFAELAWRPGGFGGLHAAVEVQHTGRLVVDDPNTDSAPAATVLNLRAGLAQQLGEWRFEQLLRVENATDRRYAGSVIVNESNRRFFEPAPPRGLMLTLTARHAWR